MRDHVWLFRNRLLFTKYIVAVMETVLPAFTDFTAAADQQRFLQYSLYTEFPSSLSLVIVLLAAQSRA
jgi:hypothetical protein